LAACSAAIATAAIVFPSPQEPIQFTSRKLVRQVASEDYEASDYADKIIFLNKNLPTAFEQISAQNLQRFSIQVNKGTICVLLPHYFYFSLSVCQSITAIFALPLSICIDVVYCN
jgi:hypothetical protein